MKLSTFLTCGALAVAVAACGGDEKPDDPPKTDPVSKAASDAASAATATASEAASETASDPAPAATATATTPPPPVPKASVAVPELRPVLAPGNRCREIETTDWTARIQGGVLKVNAKAHLRSGGWKLTIADRGLTRDLPGKQLLELVAEKPGGPATLPTGIRPIQFSKPAPGNINRVEARCGPNRIVLVRL